MYEDALNEYRCVHNVFFKPVFICGELVLVIRLGASVDKNKWPLITTFIILNTSVSCIVNLCKRFPNKQKKKDKLMYCSSCIFEMSVTPGQEQLVGHRSHQPWRAGRRLGAAVSPPPSEIYIHSWPFCVSTAAPWSQQAFWKHLCSIFWKKRRYLYIRISPPKGRAFPKKTGKTILQVSLEGNSSPSWRICAPTDWPHVFLHASYEKLVP